MINVSGCTTWLLGWKSAQSSHAHNVSSWDKNGSFAQGVVKVRIGKILSAIETEFSLRENQLHETAERCADHIIFLSGLGRYDQNVAF